MKNNFTKVLTGIFLAVFVTAFGMQSVFADSNPTRGGQTNSNSSTTGTNQCDRKCTGKTFNVYTGTGGRIPSIAQLVQEGRLKSEWCNGEFVQTGSKDYRFLNIDSLWVAGVETSYMCKGTFNFTTWFIEELKDTKSNFIAPLGAIVWLISKFALMVSSFCTELATFAIQHAFSFFSDGKVKDFIFKFWYSFATLVFSFYLVIVAVSAFQLMLGIDADNMSIKKLLPRVFYSMVITGFSFVFFLFMLDVGNVFTTVIYGTFGVSTDNAISTISSMIMPEGMSKLSAAIEILPTNALIFLQGATVTLFACLLLLAFVTLSFVLVKRTMILFIAGLLGPFAGLAYAIPGAESYTGKWAKTVAHHAVLPAILAFFIGIAIKGGDLIGDFVQSLGSANMKLFEIIEFQNGGIRLSDIVVIIWVVIFVHYGATTAIKTEYTEDAINLAKGVGEKVKGFFQPALSKTAIFAGVGGAATGAFGGTAQGALAFGAGYKGAGMAYNATEQKIMAVGKEAIHLTGTRAKLAAKGALFGTYRPENARNRFQQMASGLRDSWHTHVSGVALETKQREETSKSATEANIARQRGNHLVEEAQALRTEADRLRNLPEATQQDLRRADILEEEARIINNRGRNMRLTSDIKEAKEIEERFKHAGLADQIQILMSAERGSAASYKAAELLEPKIDQLNNQQRRQIFEWEMEELQHLADEDNEVDRLAGVEKFEGIHRAWRKKHAIFSLRGGLLDHLRDQGTYAGVQIGVDQATGRATIAAANQPNPQSPFQGAQQQLQPASIHDVAAGTQAFASKTITDNWTPGIQDEVVLQGLDYNTIINDQTLRERLASVFGYTEQQLQNINQQSLQDIQQIQNLLQQNPAPQQLQQQLPNLLPNLTPQQLQNLSQQLQNLQQQNLNQQQLQQRLLQNPDLNITVGFIRDIQLSQDVIHQLVKDGSFEGNRGELILQAGINRGEITDVVKRVSNVNVGAFNPGNPATALDIQNILRNVSRQAPNVRQAIENNQGHFASVQFHGPRTVSFTDANGVQVGPVRVQNMTDLINAIAGVPQPIANIVVQ